MLLRDLLATPHPDGHRVDLAWANAEPAAWPGVRVVRRERTHPVAPDDGVVVADGLDLAHGLDAGGHALYRVADGGLRGETTYYYSVFPYRDAPPAFALDDVAHAAALAGASHGSAARMFDLLPALYHRYDEAGRLRRFLDLPGGELDLLRSHARALLDLYDLERVDGRWLPLLADWIGWKTDHRLGVEAQRSEVRRAPGIYRRVGMIPVVGATVKRISGWESRAKEFVHNVARSNRPPRLNLRARRLDADGATVPDAETGAPRDVHLSLDDAYEGRPAIADDAQGVRWLVYHTRRRGRWRLWCKTSPVVPLGPEARPALEGADVAALQPAFAAAGLALAADATVTPAGDLWIVDDATNAERYVVEADGRTLYHTSADPLAFAPSRPLAADPRTHHSHPTLALQGDALWLFWSVYDAGAERWAVHYRLRRDGVWSEARPFAHGAAGPDVERKRPAAAVDGTGGLWLVWLEREGPRWRLRVNRHDGSGLDADPEAGWQQDPAATFDPAGPDDPRVEDDPFLIAHPDGRLVLFWARKEPTGAPHQTRWRVALCVKGSLDIAAADWGGVETLPAPDPEAHDREPSARVRPDGTVEVVWSSDRTGTWAVWRAVLDPSVPTWTDEAAVTASVYAERAPALLPVGEGALLVYRSNESLRYPSAVYRATETVDFRYAGTTTAHVRNAPLRDLRGAFGDFQTYTYDAGRAGGRTNDDWIARDTLGLYLEPDTSDPEALARGVTRLAAVLPEFMPVTDRAVFVVRPDAHTDHVYTYDRPGAPVPRFLDEVYADVLSDGVGGGLPPGEDFSDDFD